MNTSPVQIISIGVLLAGSLLAQSPVSPPEWQPLKFHQTVDPVFPAHILQVGVTTGEARVAVDTDADGKLSDLLVLGYTQPEFADASVAAIRRWEFEPARIYGEPVGSIVVLDFNFTVSGVVITTPNITETVEARTLRVRPDYFEYLPRPAQALDRQPVPCVVVAPRYPVALAKQKIKGTVRIGFYIDETGAVRLPAVLVQQNGELAALAIEAMRQWKFTPPTSGGHPVLVRAIQEFEFGNGG